MHKAVLICNGLSAEGYEAPDDRFVMTMNGGFRKHKADAAFTADCPGEHRDAWLAWDGIKVMAAHNAMYPCKKSELFDCEEDLRRYHSTTPSVLRWLLKRGMTSCLIVGMDALYGAGKPNSQYSAEGHAQFLAILAPMFKDGLYVWHDGKECLVDQAFLDRLVRFCDAVKMSAPKQEKTDKPKVAVSTSCTIPQTMIEFDPSPKCTRKCSFCDPGIPSGRRTSKTALKLSDHNRVIDQLVKCGYNNPERWLCYCGHGEPLLNKDVFKMMRYARQSLPATRMVFYTNGDKLSVEHCCTLEALDVDCVIWDCYDEKNAERVPPVIAASSLDPERVRVNDYRKGMANPSSRCSTVKDGKVSQWRNRACRMPEGKLFFTDDKDGGRWLLCCECYDRKQKWSGKLSPVELNADDGYKSIVKSLSGGGRDCCDACRRCDRDGGHPSGFEHVTKLTESELWPVPYVDPKCDGKRLVILPVNQKWARHAEVVLDAIDAASTMDGKSLVLWNDDNNKKCPDFLKGPTREVIEYDHALGWCGINVGITEAFVHAIKNGYQYAIKLDTDTAILKRGFDALLCAECGLDSQIGTYMDVSMTGMMPIEAQKHGGLFCDRFEDLRWSRGISRRNMRKWDHIQGGMYVVGVDALKRIDRVIGLDTTEQAELHESQRIGEDVYMDTKCKVAKVPQRDSQQLRIWFREPRWEKSLAPVDANCIRHQRDNCGVVAVHPVKDIKMLKELRNEI